MQESPLQFPEQLRVISSPAKTPIKNVRIRNVKTELSNDVKSPIQGMRQPQRFRSPQPNIRDQPAEPRKQLIKRQPVITENVIDSPMKPQKVMDSPRKPPIPSPRVVVARRRSVALTPGEKYSVKVAVRTRPLNNREKTNRYINPFAIELKLIL